MHQTHCVVCGRPLVFPFPVKRSKVCDAHYLPPTPLPRKPPPVGIDGNPSDGRGSGPKVLASF